MSTSRRDFLRRSILGGGALALTRPSIAQLEARALYEREFPKLGKLNIAVIGCGGKGFSDMRAVSSENIVALCDVDSKRGERAFKAQPNAKRYHDWRVMLDREKYLDAVVVSTPDHMHAVASIAAMERGLHVYCQKPLTHSVEEARLMRLVAQKHGVRTSMGNQGTAMEGVRRAAEIVRAGILGNVTDVHVWTNRPGNWWKQGMQQPDEIQAIPADFRWDLWLGPRRYRPYNKAYAPFIWRGWWDFGTGALGDMACHTMNMAYLALELDAPASVVAEQSGMTPEAGPLWSIITWEYPARGKRPPVKLTWYDGGKLPPRDLWPVDKLRSSGCLLIGDKGTLYSPNDYGAKFKLLPEAKFKDVELPEPTLPRSPGIYKEWLAACKGGPDSLAHFDYAGRLTEAVLLGNVALRSGEKIEWDQGRLAVTNSAKGNALIRDQYAYGWELG